MLVMRVSCLIEATGSFWVLRKVMVRESRIVLPRTNQGRKTHPENVIRGDSSEMVF